MIKLSTIKFSELSNYNNWNSIVMMGIYPLNESDINDVCEFFEKQMKLFEDSKVIEIKRIVSDENPVINNDHDEYNRVDWLIVFDKEDTPNAMARLDYCSWIQWTSDFMENYKKDYAKTNKKSK